MKKVLLLSLLLITAKLADAQTKLDYHKKIFNEIIEAEIKYPLIVFKQAIHESGNFSSYATRERNNIFGWNNGKMRFKSISECISYYKKWQDKYYKGGDYYTFLKKIGYARDIKYKSRVSNTKINPAIRAILEKAKNEKEFYME